MLNAIPTCLLIPWFSSLVIATGGNSASNPCRFNCSQWVGLGPPWLGYHKFCMEISLPEKYCPFSSIRTVLVFWHRFWERGFLTQSNFNSCATQMAQDRSRVKFRSIHHPRSQTVTLGYSIAQLTKLTVVSTSGSRFQINFAKESSHFSVLFQGKVLA